MPATIRLANGFTLPEMLVMLALVAVLLTAAVPGFSEIRSKSRIATATNQLLAGLHFARSGALVRNVPTAVCLSADGAHCVASTTTPANGWLLFEDTHRSSPVQIEAGDEVLRAEQLPPGVGVVGSRAATTFYPATRAATTITFTLCHAHQSRGRAVVVSQTGRPRVTEDVACAS